MTTAARVVLTGAESTGKTTLAAELATHFQVEWVPEYARAYAERKPGPLTFADVLPIARGQIDAGDAALHSARGLLIQDTDLLSTVVYSRHYYGKCPAWVEEAARARRAELYLLLHPDVPWHPDPVRDPEDRRADMHALFVAALRDLDARVVDIRGSWKERRQTAMAAVAALIEPH